MPILQLELHVREYDRWKDAFDHDPLDRGGKGVRSHRIIRSADDPNYVIVDLEFDEIEKAQSMRPGLLELWERMRDEIGLKHAEARVMEDVETKDYTSL